MDYYLIIPDNLIIPESHTDVRDEVIWFVHNLIASGRTHTIENRGWVNVSQLTHQQFIKNEKWMVVREFLTSNEIITVDHHYSHHIDPFSKAYKLGYKYCGELALYKVQDPITRRRMGIIRRGRNGTEKAPLRPRQVGNITDNRGNDKFLALVQTISSNYSKIIIRRDGVIEATEFNPDLRREAHLAYHREYNKRYYMMKRYGIKPRI